MTHPRQGVLFHLYPSACQHYYSQHPPRQGVLFRLYPSEQALEQISMSRSEYDRACELLGRMPSKVELGMIGALWSEHCGYKHSRGLFRHFPTTGDRVVTALGAENAGAVDIGNDWIAVMKIESHNHPTAIEPYEGAATGVGGIVRDIFAMGAQPVALLDSLRFGSLEQEKNRKLFKGAVRRYWWIWQLLRRSNSWR